MVRNLVITFYLVLAQAFAYNFLIFYSDLSDIQDIENFLNTYPEQFAFEKKYLLGNWDLIDFSNFDLIVDATFSEFIHDSIISISYEFSIPSIIIGYGIDKDFVVYSENSMQCYYESLISAFNYLNLSHFGLVWSFSEKNSEILDYFLKESYTIEHINIESSVNLDLTKEYMIKTVKNQGILNMVVLGNKNSCGIIDQALQYAKMQILGYFSLYFDECIYQISSQNSLIFVKSSLKSSVSYPNYIFNSIFPYLSIFLNKTLPNYSVLNLFGSLKSCNYSLINIQNDLKVEVAIISNQNMQKLKDIYYYGDSLNKPYYSMPNITISANTGIKNPPGYADVYQNQKYQVGTYYGISKINSDHYLLPNFNLVLFDSIDCGVNIFVYNYSKNCFLSIKNQLGVVYIPSFYSITINVLLQFYQLGIDIPFISGIGASSNLSSITEFPTFARLTSSIDAITNVQVKYLNIMNWNNIVVFYSNEPYGKEIYAELLQSQSESHLFIMNSEKYRAIPQNYNSSVYSLYEANIEDAVNTGCNIFVLAMTDPTPYFWIEALYDYGIRRGDILIFFTTTTGIDAINSTGGDPVKRAELMHGSFVVYNAAWVGEYGLEIKQDYLTVYKNAWMPSFYIDSIFTIANVLDFLLRQGKDFTNHSIFIDALRKIRLIGCTGTISFDSASNDRNLVYYNLYNFYQNQTDSVWYGDSVALISPLSSIYYTSLKEPVWPGGVLPSGMKKFYSNCDFTVNSVTDCSIGKIIKIFIYCGLLFAIVSFTCWLGKFVKDVKFEMINQRVKAEFEDYLVLGFIFVGNLQLISIGPSFSSFNQGFQNIIQFFSLNISSSDNFGPAFYWIAFYSVSLMVYIWLFLLILSSKLKVSMASNIYIVLQQFRKLLIPIFDTYLFTPIIVILFSIFSCDYGTGSKISQCFSNYDCKLFCWKDFHLIYSVSSIFLLLVFVPFSIYYKVNLQDQNVNIKINPRFVMVQRIIYIVIIILSRIIADQSPFGYAVIFTLITFLLVFYIYYKKPYNFDRANLWSYYLSLCVVWGGVVCIFDFVYSIKYYYLILVQFGGWILLIGIAAIVQNHLPESYLMTEKGKNIVNLFRFLFNLTLFDNVVHQTINTERTNFQMSVDEIKQ